MFEYYLPGNSIDCRDAPVGDDGSDAREHHETESNVVIIVGANGSGKSKLGAWLERQDQDHVHRIVAQRKLNPSEFTPLKSFEVAENYVRFGLGRPGRKDVYKWGGESETTKLVDDYDDTLAGLLAERNNISNAFREECSKADAAADLILLLRWRSSIIYSKSGRRFFLKEGLENGTRNLRRS